MVTKIHENSFADQQDAEYGRKADGFIEEIEEGMPGGRGTVESPVIKVFNTM